jgi:CheY-like chemotaxis protein
MSDAPPVHRHVGPHNTILVVEDDPDMRELMAVWLRTEGFVVRLARNGEEALTSLREELPCAMVVDLNMPIMDGAELRRRQRHLHPGSEVPFILVSASGESERIGQALGVTDVIPKPFDSARLLDSLHTHCRFT